MSFWRTIVSIGIISYILVSTAILGLTAILVSYFSRTGNAPHLVARLWGRLILFFSHVPVKVQGIDRLSSGRSCIYMVNHQSNFDIPALLAFLPVQFRWLAKEELFRIPVFGRSMRGCGYISIDRSDRRSAFKSLKLAAETIRGGVSVLIFPEGTRSVDGKIQAFKKGGFVLAVESGVPIVPLCIQGTHAIMPKGHLSVRPGPVTIKILTPIDTTVYTYKTKELLMDEVHRAISSALDEAGGSRVC
jgi:1-acyl-sn-glycerol-3-phosphate acyltransferase